MQKHIAVTAYVASAIGALGLSAITLAAQSGAPPPRPSAAPAPAGVQAPAALVPSATPATPPGYVIGPDDLLSIVFWKDPTMTTDVVVRPDGKISLPLLNELTAAGQTPEQLRAAVAQAATKYFEDPSVNVVVKQVNSRKVFITGEVNKPATYALSGPMTVLQLIALAGGLSDFAKKDEIAVLRTENGKQARYAVKYNEIIKGKNLQQNIELKVGDVIVVP